AQPRVNLSLRSFAEPHNVMRRQLKDYAAFVEALRSGKLDDRLDYAH
ncbi:MAG: hypothetical protein ACI9VS_003555, partial [Candidatus Binatia bacterium]